MAKIVVAEGGDLLKWLEDAASVSAEDIPVPKVPFNADQTVEDCQFVLYHAAHPEVYLGLCGIAMALVSLGMGRASFKLVWELYRAKVRRAFRKTTLRNTYASRYVRLIALTRPELKSFFNISRMRSKH